MEKPIIFSGPMVRAQRAGLKTQTRRIIKVQPSAEATSAGVYFDSKGTRPNAWTWLSGDPKDLDTCEALENFTLPYAVGDRLWTKESFSAHWGNRPDERGLPFRRLFCGEQIKQHDGKISITSWENSLFVYYKADCPHKPLDRPWTASMFMPRWASRVLTDPVEDVRVQRLQDITEEDALAEGVQARPDGSGFDVPGVLHPDKNFPYLARPTAREMYAALWDSIHGSGAWEANPWVSAITFREVKA